MRVACGYAWGLGSRPGPPLTWGGVLGEIGSDAAAPDGGLSMQARGCDSVVVAGTFCSARGEAPQGDPSNPLPAHTAVAHPG
jgi:hypothetical protein